MRGDVPGLLGEDALAGVVTTADGIVHVAHTNFFDGKSSPLCDALDLQYVWQETGVVTCIECLAYDPDYWIRAWLTNSRRSYSWNFRRAYSWNFRDVYVDKKKGDGDG